MPPATASCWSTAGRIQPFDGDLDDYRDWLATRRAEVAAAAACPDQAADKAARKADRAQAAADRQARLAARRPLVKEIEQIDKRLAAWNKEKAEIDAQLADPALYTGPQAGEVPALNKRQAELAGRIEEAELRWLDCTRRWRRSRRTEAGEPLVRACRRSYRASQRAGSMFQAAKVLVGDDAVLRPPQVRSSGCR